MIKIPTKLRIYSPAMLANIDFTAEPELEGKTGSTYRGVAIADGGHAINAADGFPGHVLTVDQAPNADAFNIEFAMTLIKKINSVVLDGHNLLSAYAANLRDSFKIKHSATDVLGALVENEIRYSGLLGKERAFNRYDGLTAKTVVADDPNLNFGANSDFSLSRWVRTTNTTSTDILFDKGGAFGPRYLLFVSANGLVTGRVDDSVTNADSVSTTSINDGEWHLVTYTVNRDGNGIIYIDGVAEGSVDASSVGDIDDATEPLTFGIESENETANPFEGDMSDGLIYNRVLAPKEIEQMALGVPVPKPLIIGDNSTFNSLGNWTPVGGATLAIIDSGDAGHERVLQIVAGGTTDRGAELIFPEPLVAGHRQLITVDRKWINSDGLSNPTVGSILISAPTVNIIGFATDVGMWVSEEIPFTATGGETLTEVLVNRFADPGSANNELLIDNFYITDLDTKVTFPLLVDQWGKANVVANGELWTGATGATPPNSWTDLVGGGFNIRDGSGLSGAPPGADTSLQITIGVAGSDPTITQALAVENGQDYQMRVWGTIGAIASSNPADGFRIRLGTTSGGSEIFDSGTLTDLVWVLTTHDFTTTGTTIYLTLTTVGAVQVESATFDFAVVDNPGAVAAYLDDGISADQAKWLDASSNNLHGVNTNVETIDAPAGDVRGFVVSQFDEITNHKFWQMVFNEDLDAALLDILIGQVAGCWYRDYEIAAGGFKGKAGFPGVKLGMNESGRDNPEQKFGEKPDWDLTLRVTDDEGINDLEEFVRTVSGALLPAWIVFDPPTDNNLIKEPVFERVTLIESMFPWEFKFGQTLPWQVGLKFSRRLD